jgi:hypothetical protein
VSAWHGGIVPFEKGSSITFAKNVMRWVHY